MMPRLREINVRTFWQWFFHVSLSSMTTPKNVHEFTCSITLLLRRIFTFLSTDLFVKTIACVFLKFKDNLLHVTHSQTLPNSLFMRVTASFKKNSTIENVCIICTYDKFQKLGRITDVININKKYSRARLVISKIDTWHVMMNGPMRILLSVLNMYEV